MKRILIALQIFVAAAPAVGQDTIRVREGWNVIGSLSTAVVAESLGTRPCGIIASRIWQYVPGQGYRSVDTLKRGEGYLVRVLSDGYLIPGLPTCPSGICDTTAIAYGGKVYHTVPIGNQCWLRENIDLGTMIQGTDSSFDDGIIEKYCYNNDPQACATYGGLYQWGEAMAYDTTPGATGICPPGWHLPTVTEFETMESTVGYNHPDEMRAEKSNTSGFSAYLGGIRSSENSGAFMMSGQFAWFWTSTQREDEEGMGMTFGIGWYYTGSGWLWKPDGVSVRCLQD